MGCRVVREYIFSVVRSDKWCPWSTTAPQCVKFWKMSGTKRKLMHFLASGFGSLHFASTFGSSCRLTVNAFLLAIFVLFNVWFISQNNGQSRNNNHRRRHHRFGSVRFGWTNRLCLWLDNPNPNPNRTWNLKCWPLDHENRWPHQENEKRPLPRGKRVCQKPLSK